MPTKNRPFEDDTAIEGRYVLVGDALFYGLKNEISRAINERQLP
jgi:hypothetical protein